MGSGTVLIVCVKFTAQDYMSAGSTREWIYIHTGNSPLIQESSDIHNLSSL